MTQMTQKQVEAIQNMNSALKSENGSAEVLHNIYEFMHAMPDSGPLDSKVAQELFHDTPIRQDVDVQDEKGDTLLHHFIRNSDGKNVDHKEMLSHILQDRPNPFIANNDGITPMECLTADNAVDFAPVLARYTSDYNKNMGSQLRELISYAVIEPDMNKELSEFKTSRQSFVTIANKMSGKNGER